jgi:hypothetical protein
MLEYRRAGISKEWTALAPGMEIGYVIRDAKKREEILKGMLRNLMLNIIGSC